MNSIVFAKVCQLILYTNFINISLENGYQVDSVYADFSKSFDIANHKILILKLDCYGLGDQMLTYIES